MSDRETNNLSLIVDKLPDRQSEGTRGELTEGELEAISAGGKVIFVGRPALLGFGLVGGFFRPALFIF